MFQEIFFIMEFLIDSGIQGRRGRELQFSNPEGS